MSDPFVAKWRQRGTVYLWRYTRSPKAYHGWNLSADPHGCESLLALLDLMIASPYSSRATIRISSPTSEALSAVNGPERWLSASELNLHHPKFKSEARHWHLTSSVNRVVLTLGLERLQEVRRGVVDVANGTGDWAAQNDDDAIDDAQVLFFWPLVWARASRAYGG